MATVAQMAPTEQAVQYAASEAHARYTAQADSTRITKGLALILAGNVTLNSDGSADIRSQSGPDIYHVNGRCGCMDFARGTARCKHRYAKALFHRAHRILARAYYATYSDWRGEDFQGIAFPNTDGTDWLFLPESSGDVWHADKEEIVLGGNVALADAQHAADGNLIAKVCGY